MCKLAIIFVVLAYSSAKLVRDVIKDVDVDPDVDVRPKIRSSVDSKYSLWVLDLNDDELNYKRISSPNKMDRRVFREVVEPAIKNYEYQQLLMAGKQSKTNLPIPELDVDTQDITKYDVKKEILWMFNKFIMPYTGEPSLRFHLGDNNKVSIRLYFQGPYTSLVVRYKNKRLNYFLQPPSSLPHWFYEKHTKMVHIGQSTFVDIPDSVRKELYGKLFYMLQGIISFALI